MPVAPEWLSGSGYAFSFNLEQMLSMGKLLVFAGLVIAAVGLGLMLLGRTNLPIGRLPGDIIYRGKNTSFYFPLTTCILVSVVLTLVFYLLGKMRH